MLLPDYASRHNFDGWLHAGHTQLELTCSPNDQVAIQIPHVVVFE